MSAERTNVDGAGRQNGDRADAAEDEYGLRLTLVYGPGEVRMPS